MFNPRERAIAKRMDAFEREALGEMADFDIDLLEVKKEKTDFDGDYADPDFDNLDPGDEDFEE